VIGNLSLALPLTLTPTLTLALTLPLPLPLNKGRPVVWRGGRHDRAGDNRGTYGGRSTGEICCFSRFENCFVFSTYNLKIRTERVNGSGRNSSRFAVH